MREYPIWGVPPGGGAETILYTRATTLAEARRVAAILKEKHGCTAVRIQSLDLSAPGESVQAAFLAVVRR